MSAWWYALALPRNDGRSALWSRRRMHDPELHELRRQLAQTPTGRGIYYPDSLRERLSTWAYRRRDQGAPWPVIAAELGCNNSTLRRWVQREGGRQRRHTKPSTALVAVEVVGGNPPVIAEATTAGTAAVPTRVSIVSPAGFRIEGLTFEEALIALQRLG